MILYLPVEGGNDRQFIEKVIAPSKAQRKVHSPRHAKAEFVSTEYAAVYNRPSRNRRWCAESRPLGETDDA